MSVPTYKPGDLIPRSGEAQCTLAPDSTERVTAGMTFQLCDKSDDHYPETCLWEYVEN
jgi:hypothetical protein